MLNVWTKVIHRNATLVFLSLVVSFMFLSWALLTVANSHPHSVCNSESYGMKLSYLLIKTVQRWKNMSNVLPVQDMIVNSEFWSFSCDQTSLFSDVVYYNSILQLFLLWFRSRLGTCKCYKWLSALYMMLLLTVWSPPNLPYVDCLVS